MLSLTWKKNPKKLDLEGLPKNLDISIGDKFTQIFIPTNGYNLLSLERPGSANVYSGRFQFMIKVASPYFLTLDRRFVAADSHSSALAETGIQLPKAACLDALSQPCETKAPTADTSGHISGTFVISIAKLQAAVSHFTDISKGHKCTIILLECVVFFQKNWRAISDPAAVFVGTRSKEDCRPDTSFIAAFFHDPMFIVFRS